MIPVWCTNAGPQKKVPGRNSGVARKAKGGAPDDSTWRFPEMGVPPNHPNSNGIFQWKTCITIIFGIPPFMETTHINLQAMDRNGTFKQVSPSFFFVAGDIRSLNVTWWPTFLVPQLQCPAGVVAPAPGAIMSFDNREDFEKNLNGSLTVVAWKESKSRWEQQCQAMGSWVFFPFMWSSVLQLYSMLNGVVPLIYCIVYIGNWKPMDDINTWAAFTVRQDFELVNWAQTKSLPKRILDQPSMAPSYGGECLSF